MRLGSLFVTIFGVAIAGGSVFVAKDYLNDTSGAANATAVAETVDVLVARTDIEFGVPIEAQMVGTQQWPREAVPPGAFTKLDEVIGGQGGEPRRAKGRFYPGELILASKVSGFGEKVTIVQKLGANSRAMAIRVNAESGVGGFVTPGDFIDIVMTQVGNGTVSAVTILQNIRVIGVDQQSAEEATQPDVARTITVEVSPEQGQKLALAQRVGTLSLTLRTLDSIVDEPLDMVELRDLLQEKSPVEAQPKKPQIVIRRGTEVEAVDVN